MGGFITAGIIVGGSGMLLGGASLVMGSLKSGKANEMAEEANDLAEKNMKIQAGIARDALKFQKEEAAKLEVQKNKYRAIEFKNPYENIENVYEDLTVNQGEAQFSKEMFQQSQADIMQSLRGAAGSSGIASLAQTLSSDAQRQSQRASLSIGQQERANEMAKLGEAKNIDMKFRAGEASVEEKEMNRQSTLLGMQMGTLSGANSAVMQSQQNQMAAGAAQANLYGQQAASQQAAASKIMSSSMGLASSAAFACGEAYGEG